MRTSRDGGESSPTFRSYQRNSSSDSGENTVQRNFGRGSSESRQFSRRFEQGESNRSIGEWGRSRSESGDSQSPNRREYVAGRATNDQVRDFLQMRRDGSPNQSDGENNQPGGTNQGQRRFDGNFNRGGDRAMTDGSTDVTRQQDFRNRVNESQNEGDRAWARRFGGANSNRNDNDRADQARRDNNEGSRIGDFTRRAGDSSRLDDRRGGDNRDLTDSGVRNRDFGERKFVDSKYQAWRKDAWRGEDGKGRDHRDWSGRWKDGDRFVAADRIRKDWHKDWDRDRDHDDFPFHSGWKKHRWHGHSHWNRWDYWNHWAHFHRRPWFWWGWATAPYLTSWINFGWNTPYYWDYGPGEYIYCDDNVIYVNGRWFQPAPVYYEDTLVLAQKAPDWTPEQAQQVEWLPLGVFAVARDGVADKNLLMQLAVTKDGVIGGTATNQLTGASFPIEGSVDKNTQRAVWMYTNDKNARIMMETGVYNLTQPEATGLVHYGPDDIQVVELVRLEQPEGSAGSSTTAPNATSPEALPTP
jgi:hypothetical protein